MGRAQKKPVTRENNSRDSKADQQVMREQEVLRANRELAAYFKGQRTEREARAALKIIKAFIRDRERMDAGSRRPLPGVRSDATEKSSRKTKTATPAKKVRRRSVRRPVPVPVPTPEDANVGADDAPLDRGA